VLALILSSSLISKLLAQDASLFEINKVEFYSNQDSLSDKDKEPLHSVLGFQTGGF
jgi:hypothetical protein